MIAALLTELSTFSKDPTFVEYFPSAFYWILRCGTQGYGRQPIMLRNRTKTVENLRLSRGKFNADVPKAHAGLVFSPHYEQSQG